MEQAHQGLLKVSLNGPFWAIWAIFPSMGYFQGPTFLADDGAGMGGEALKWHAIQLWHYKQRFPQPQMQDVFVELREIRVG
jgi:hypothetical protein